MEEKSVAGTEEPGNTIERLHSTRSRRPLRDEQKLFVMDGIDDHEDSKRNKTDSSDIKHKFFLGLVLRVHVPVEQVWYVYRNGKFYKKLTVGMHILWNWGNFLTKWQIRRINLRAVLLPALAYGRVEGPELPHGSDKGATMSLALDVVAELRLLCRLSNIERFLSYELPIGVFYASLNDIVQDCISKLPYDQYGKWATVLRDQVQADLQRGKDNIEALIGVKIEKVFVDSFAFSGEHHAEILKLYQLVESGKRELEGAISLERQSQLLDIAPSILALQNNEIGRELIRHDAKLRELMIAAGRPKLPSGTPDLYLSGYPGNVHQTSTPPSPSGIRLSLLAITRITLEADDIAFVNNVYTVQAGISRNKPENFEGEPFDVGLNDTTESLLFDILLHASKNVELLQGGQKRVQYYLRSLNTQIVEFPFKVTTIGHAHFDINFYQERHWLKTVRLEFTVIERTLRDKNAS